MLEEIEKLNSNNKDEFIKKYGLIKDPEVAKDLLCITSNTWMVLDDSLKENSEIIMYYQPVAVLNCHLEEDMGGVYEITTSCDVSQKGFKIISNYSRIKDLYNTDMAKYVKRLGNKIQIPEIKYPKDFDIEKYIEIQERLCEEFDYCKDIKNAKEVIKNIDFAEYNLEKTVPHFKYQEPADEFTYYTVYNRKRLKEIINEVLYEDEKGLESNGKHI